MAWETHKELCSCSQLFWNALPLSCRRKVNACIMFCMGENACPEDMGWELPLWLLGHPRAGEGSKEAQELDSGLPATIQNGITDQDTAIKAGSSPVLHWSYKQLQHQMLCGFSHCTQGLGLLGYLVPLHEVLMRPFKILVCYLKRQKQIMYLR